MKTYSFKGILQNNGWRENTCISINDKGIITKIYDSTSNVDSIENINGYAIPGFQNTHSHAFQYAMAGLAEKHQEAANQDDFWGWREAMYQLALSINPDQMETIATMLYSEMARHGYTNVAEFHYVHHDQQGNPYTDLSEMGSRLVAAAKTAGIAITLVPIFYQKGGFGLAPNQRQRRFISPTVDDYLKLVEASVKACSYYEQATFGIGVHSMRAVEPTDIIKITKSGPQDIPFHIHVAEQLKEIEECIKYVNRRPVDWLLDHLDLNDRFHLVHATHISKDETIRLAKSKANVILCPSTEGNLGDGLFPLKNYQKAGGNWSIGTDSHIGLNPLEELRILDYGQRVTSHKRNTYFSNKQLDAGMYAIEMATLTGRKAMNNYTTSFFEVGQPLNACIIDATAPLIATSSIDNLTGTIIYASDNRTQWGTIAQGKLIVKNGTHFDHEIITNQFIKGIKELKNR
ncbi:formimidoylglutamate deiminase [Aquimarina addita]|uniref:Formimidoylglutamate deiminase n=1 Tax=Aquimarina addita TaxID=870485 RepID=A0ABP7XES5_9FLAO